MILSKRMLKDTIMASLLYKVLNFDLKTLFKKPQALSAQPKPAPKPAAQPKKAPARQVDLPTTPFQRAAESNPIIARNVLESRVQPRKPQPQENIRVAREQAVQYDRARGEQAARAEAARRRREQDEMDEADRRRRAADDSLMFASMYSSPSPSQHRSCTSTPVTQDTDTDRYSCSRSYTESPQSAGADSGSPSESYSSPSE